VVRCESASKCRRPNEIGEQYCSVCMSVRDRIFTSLYASDNPLWNDVVQQVLKTLPFLLNFDRPSEVPIQ